ncbi:unnamed protein product [Nezara viridula]|uniref:Transmembrane protein 231 n=1 Tax=Nezara viridula TaxID=85310 RepID=A0A9P0MNU3_NEZVI|nr:unnamed protein product [Nezara viridula]
MVQYVIFSESLRCYYKTSICSKATIVIFIINMFTFFVPFLLAYKTQGLWQKTDHYREQPEVHFKYDYFVLLEADKIEKPVICTTFPSLVYVTEVYDTCRSIKVREEDHNKDGLNDKIIFEVEADLDTYENVYAVTVILIFNYKLHSYSQFQMESAGWIECHSPFGGAKLHVTTDLRLRQRQPLRHKGRDLRFNTTLSMESELGLSSFLQAYAERNVTTRLDNIYSTWTRGKAAGDPFKFSLGINIPEETILYTPGFWQIIKMAWVQYLSLLYLSILVSRRVKHFILDNRLVHNIKVQPWKHMH